MKPSETIRNHPSFELEFWANPGQKGLKHVFLQLFTEIRAPFGAFPAGVYVVWDPRWKKGRVGSRIADAGVPSCQPQVAVEGAACWRWGQFRGQLMLTFCTGKMYSDESDEINFAQFFGHHDVHDVHGYRSSLLKSFVVTLFVRWRRLRDRVDS